MLQPGWTAVSPVCQDVTLNSNRPETVLDYPGAGDDTFDSGASVKIDLGPSGAENVTLNGPTTVHRSSPCIGCGPGGRDTIQTELVQMTLTGTSPLFGPIQLRESPILVSPGQVSQQTPGADFPADSFFDVFVEIDTLSGTLHNQQPLHMQSVIHALPPINEPYSSTASVQLYNSVGQPVGTLTRATHVPLKPKEIIIVIINHPPPFFSLFGLVRYCTNPNLSPIPNVTLNVTGSSTATTQTNSSGNYTFSLPSSGNYTVTPTKAALTPGSLGITTVDVIAIQRHFLTIGVPLSGCRLTAADVNGINGVDTVDVIAVQRFFLNYTTGIANVGRYRFNPLNRSYSPLNSDQTGQNYDAIVFGDVAPQYVH